ncbi:uncharacterized protein MONBRDRAFT_8569 [Monosiga brevicollis MX1]|uniref:Uncharacterized protein n=1 Tax=Monosiga brevicollis TaxID=81824 RepID=A9V0F5_MONBE|nr:uncharacterized protein MONBRDRAFT_8569 [Monosiga brevicollis MX1]EDQ89148.1 predicted protein [Monosiga brevicollis MX1]|eukprot:XP_001746253.1 hypothetical protein [Monosiga brevicollis MX1]
MDCYDMAATVWLQHALFGAAYARQKADANARLCEQAREGRLNDSHPSDQFQIRPSLSSDITHASSTPSPKRVRRAAGGLAEGPAPPNWGALALEQQLLANRLMQHRVAHPTVTPSLNLAFLEPELSAPEEETLMHALVQHGHEAEARQLTSRLRALRHMRVLRTEQRAAYAALQRAQLLPTTSTSNYRPGLEASPSSPAPLLARLLKARVKALAPSSTDQATNAACASVLRDLAQQWLAILDLPSSSTDTSPPTPPSKVTYALSFLSILHHTSGSNSRIIPSHRGQFALGDVVCHGETRSHGLMEEQGGKRAEAEAEQPGDAVGPAFGQAVHTERESRAIASLLRTLMKAYRNLTCDALDSHDA